MTIHVDTGMRSFDEHVFIPSTPGPHPLVSVSPGLQQRSAAYVPYLRRLASHGIIAISHDDFGALVHNVDSETAVDKLLAEAVVAGARLARPADKVFWGGYRGYFADPDGFLWEICWNPFFPLDDQGHVQLPE